jgi:hypothetical protein
MIGNIGYGNGVSSDDGFAGAGVNGIGGTGMSIAMRMKRNRDA